MDSYNLMLHYEPFWSVNTNSDEKVKKFLDVNKIELSLNTLSELWRELKGGEKRKSLGTLKTSTVLIISYNWHLLAVFNRDSSAQLYHTART